MSLLQNKTAVADSIRAFASLPAHFVASSLGSNQGTAISIAEDPVTTGGHTDSNRRKNISICGCEECCGVQWQMSNETADKYTETAEVFDSNDTDISGQHINPPYRALYGGNWDYGSYCGSRCSVWDTNPINLNAARAARGIANPL